MPADGWFTCDDLEEAAELVTAAWRTGLDGDWSQPAGTVEWSCARTADHTIDSIHAVATFLASRRQDGYPDWWPELTMGSDPRPEDLVDGLATVVTILSGVIAITAPTERAVIWRWPRTEVRGPEDFAPRGALELLLHGHDVATGLGVPLAPPAALCRRLLDHTTGWPHWNAPGWTAPRPSDDPWAELLRASGRGEI